MSSITQKGDERWKRKRSCSPIAGFGDCAGYSGEIAEKANDLKETMDNYKFEMSASCLFSKELKDYDKLVEMLGFLTGLKCERICREREDTEKSCNIRK